MITGYEIKKDNSEEVLILHINYDEEFSLEFFRGKRRKNTKEWVTEYIKDEKINWNGNKIVLMIGGVALGTLVMLGTPSHPDQPNYTYVSDIAIPLVEEKAVPEKENTEIEKVNKEESSFSNHKVEKNVVNEKDSKHQAYSQETNNLSSTIEETNSQNTSLPTEKEVTLHRKDGSILTLAMNDYLIGVVASEMPASFPLEALKAQSVVARTYALKRIENGQQLTDTVSTQVYKDNNQLREEWQENFDIYYNKIKLAVTSTDHITIKYQGDYIDAVYHSTSNGKTEDAVHVWGNSIPYLKSVESNWDKNSSSYLRTEEKELNIILDLLGIDLQNENNIEILSRNESGRVLAVKIGNQNYSGVELRNLLGLRSTDFDIEVQDNKVIFTTRGYGHGVGMSQYGAKGMAENGYNYQQILRHYYQGISISTE